MSTSVGGDSQKQEMRSSDSGSSEDGTAGHSGRKRKEPPTAAEEAATASLMSLPRKLSNNNTVYIRKDASDASSKDRSDCDLDLSTIEGQQALNPNMSIEEARFQVRSWRKILLVIVIHNIYFFVFLRQKGNIIV